jgi:Flp pilus assembly protein TadD
MPRDAALHHALGLLLTRKGDNGAAQKEFAEAAKLDPANARYAYVQAISLHSAGKRVEALAVLRNASNRHPDDLDVLSALISINREAGDRQAALRYAKQAAKLLPNDQSLSKLVAELEAR